MQRRISAQPARQKRADHTAGKGQRQRKEQSDEEAVLHHAARALLICGADALGHLNRKAAGSGGAQPAQQPCARRYDADRR